ADFIVPERQKCGSQIFEGLWFLVCFHAAALELANVYGPPLVQELQKDCPTRDNDVQRPAFKVLVLFQADDQGLSELSWDIGLGVMPLTKHAQQVRNALDHCRLNAENVSQ